MLLRSFFWSACFLVQPVQFFGRYYEVRTAAVQRQNINGSSVPPPALLDITLLNAKNLGPAIRALRGEFAL